MTAPVPMPAPPAQRTIPFDYTFRVELEGEPDTLHQQSITVSVEGTFTAVAIGYGVVPLQEPVRFGPAGPQVIQRLALNNAAIFGVAQPVAVAPAAVALPPAAIQPQNVPVPLSIIAIADVLQAAERALAAGELFRGREDDPTRVLDYGFRLNPEFLESVLGTDGNVRIDPADLPRLFQLVAPAIESVPFLYALHDQGSGRSFQSDPILSVAGLGSADGERPFRRFAVPIVFDPLTSIRLDVTELVDQRAILYVSLHGYKTLGQAGTPTGRTRRRRRL